MGGFTTHRWESGQECEIEVKLEVSKSEVEYEPGVKVEFPPPDLIMLLLVKCYL